MLSSRHGRRPFALAPLGLARWLSLPAAMLLCVPLFTLVKETPWLHWPQVYGDAQAVAVSLSLSAVSLLLVALLGTPLAFWLARTASAWRHVWKSAALALMLAPPLALGILLISAYGPYSSLGVALAHLGGELNNNAAAFVLAQLYGGLAYYVLIAAAAFEGVARNEEEAAAVLGASGWATFTRVTLPLALPGLVTGLALSWSRVIGEFGIVLVFAYFPQGIPVKLFVNLQNEGVDATYGLLWLLLLTALPLPLLCLAWLRKPAARLASGL